MNPRPTTSRVLSAFADAATDFGGFTPDEFDGPLGRTGPLKLGPLGEEVMLQKEIINWTVSWFLYLWTAEVPCLKPLSKSLSENPENPGDRLKELCDRAAEIALLAQYKAFQRVGRTGLMSVKGCAYHIRVCGGSAGNCTGCEEADRLGSGSKFISLCDLAKGTATTDAAAVAAEIVLGLYLETDKDAPEGTSKGLVRIIRPNSTLSKISQLSDTVLSTHMKTSRESIMNLFRAMCADARKWAGRAET